MKEVLTDNYIQIIDGLYTYSVNCPSCQTSPEVEVDNSAAIGCKTCKSIGEITLKLTEEELSDLYQEYIKYTLQSHESCPIIQRDLALDNNKKPASCPISRNREKGIN